jgi:hypothetical protein
MKSGSYRWTRSLLLRGLGLVYLAAFGSLAVQVDGLIGSQGILPASEYLERVGRVLGEGTVRYRLLPTLLWLGASDGALHALCWGGLAMSALVVAGIVPGPCLALLWAFYLSLTVVGQEFLSFQWDALLLESGLLALLLTPWGTRLGRAGDEPWWLPEWLFRWLVFRLMLLSGALKLASGDPTWWTGRALDYHYETQPLPVWTSWYMHQMPEWFGWLSVWLMFYAEIVAPFFVWGPRLWRRVGFVSMALLQTLIAATGNYGFFNLLTLVLCLSVFDDQDLKWVASVAQRVAKPGWRVIRGRWSEPLPGGVGGATAAGDVQAETYAPAVTRPWSIPRRATVGAIAALLVTATAAQTLESLFPWIELPVAVQMVSQALEPLRSTNSYGLFRVMTRERPEITIEASEDGSSWKPYRFRWKPGELDRAPRFTTPHMPRLDWQMWFAALAGDCRAAPWFLQFERRLLSGTPEVLALLRENPFPEGPPRYLRARLDRYTFTRWGSPDWWAREELGMFCPPMVSGH